MSFEHFIIRPATVDDVPEAVTVQHQCQRETLDGLRPESFFVTQRNNIQSDIDWWTRGIQAGAQLLLAVDPNNKIIGLAGATPTLPADADTGVEIEMGVLHVLKEFDTADTKARLLETVLMGRNALVWVLKEDTNTVKFYTRHGFIPDGQHETLEAEWAGLTDMRMVRRNARVGT